MGCNPFPSLDAFYPIWYTLGMPNTLSNDDTAANLAANIRRLLDQRGWNQSDLARITGDGDNTISRVCRAENTVNIGVLARIAAAFDVSSDRLLAKPPKENQKSQPDQG